MIFPEAVMQAFRPDRPAVGFKVFSDFTYPVCVFPNPVSRHKGCIGHRAAGFQAVIHPPLLAVVWIAKIGVKDPA
jgi:hypothetical protein